MAEPNGIVDSAVKAASAGGGFAGVLLAVRWVLNWLTGRWDARAARIDAQDAKVDLQWQQIREATEARAETLTKDVTALAERLTAAEAKIAAQTVRLGQQEFVLKLVITELDRVDPGNTVAKQARILLEQVQPAAFAARTKPTVQEAVLLDEIDGREQ